MDINLGQVVTERKSKSIKYRMTATKIFHQGAYLYRIQALKDFGNVLKGEYGGYIEKEANLSQEGNCWVYDEAKVYNEAGVFDNAVVDKNAWVFDNAVVEGSAYVSGRSRIGGNIVISKNEEAINKIRCPSLCAPSYRKSRKRVAKEMRKAKLIKGTAAGVAGVDEPIKRPKRISNALIGSIDILD